MNFSSRPDVVKALQRALLHGGITTKILRLLLWRVHRYLIYIYFRSVFAMFIENHVFIGGKWAGHTQELSRIYLEVVSDLEFVLKSPFRLAKKWLCVRGSFFGHTF